MDMISPKEIYSAIVQLVIHSESITWNRFNAYLMGNSILVLSWATIFISKERSFMITFIMLIICLLGCIMGLAFAALGFRGRKFLYEYIKMGARIENDCECWLNELDKYKPANRTQYIRDKIPYSRFGSRFILTACPLAFVVLYNVLLIASSIR